MSRHVRSRAVVAGEPRLLRVDEVRRLATVVDGVDQRVARIAEAQGGPVATWQLELVGMSRDMARHRRQRGRLHSPLRGVHLPGHMTWNAGGQAIGALLSLGTGWLCAGTACWSHAMLQHPPPVPHVLCRGTGRRQRVGMRLHVAGHVDDADVGVRRGVPVVSPVRALLELAESASARSVAEAMATGEVLGLLTREEVGDALSRWPGRHGVRMLQEELGADRRPAATRSESERRFRRLWRQVAWWPPYAVNRFINGKQYDVVFADLRLAIEIDGGHHFTEAAAQHDRRRDNVSQAEGFVTRRISGDQLRDEALVVASHVSAWIARADERVFLARQAVAS